MVLFNDEDSSLRRRQARPDAPLPGAQTLRDGF
jgi:hypothetical protein